MVNQLEKIRKFGVVLSFWSHETGSTAEKVTASDLAKLGPHIHTKFYVNSRSKVSIHIFYF